MKPIFCAGILLAVALQAVSPAMTNAAALPAPTPWVAASRDASSTVWQRTAYSQSPDGSVVPQAQQYVELATGLNYWNGTRYVPSSDQILLSPDGASALATNSEHHVIWPGNILAENIKLITAQGEVVQSQPLSLSYFDGTNTVLLATVTNSIGAILPSGNEVIYSNAFAGLDVDLRYKNTVAGMAQDVVLQQQLPDPTSMGLNAASTRLQMVTEFFPSSPPSVTPTTMMTPIGNLEDDSIALGSMRLIRGKAFLSGSSSASTGVARRWITVNGRQFLIEEIAYVSIAQSLRSLPPFITNRTAAGSPRFVRRSGSLRELLADLAAASRGHSRPKAARMQLARAASSKKGFVVDYFALNSSYTNGFTFQGDSTYLVSGLVELERTNTFEAGATIKFSSNAVLYLVGRPDPRQPQYAIPLVINWLGTAYHPVVLTASDDNSVGLPIGSGSPSGYYANPALLIESSSTTQHQRVSDHVCPTGRHPGWRRHVVLQWPGPELSEWILRLQ